VYFNTIAFYFTTSSSPGQLIQCKLRWLFK